MGRKLNRRRKKTVAPESVEARKSGLVITLRRRDALVRQLDTAIQMWFLGQDSVSIHLLVNARVPRSARFRGKYRKWAEHARVRAR